MKLFISASDTSEKFSSIFNKFLREHESSNNLQEMENLIVSYGEIGCTIPCLVCSKEFNFCLHWVL